MSDFYWRVVKDSSGKPTVTYTKEYDYYTDTEFLTDEKFHREDDAYRWITRNSVQSTSMLEEKIEELEARILKLERKTRGL
jgi:hypothetical protein